MKFAPVTVSSVPPRTLPNVGDTPVTPAVGAYAKCTTLGAKSCPLLVIRSGTRSGHPAARGGA